MMSVLSRRVLFAVCCLPLFVSSAHAERSEGFRLGLGGGIFQMNAKAPNDPGTYKAYSPGYVARFGYAFSPAWEIGAMISGGGSKTDTIGVNTVGLKMPLLPQAYILGRHYLNSSFGMYGLLSAGSLKRESLNAANQVIDSRRSFALGAGAGIFWDMSDHYSVDIGGFMPGIPLSNPNNRLKTYTPGLLVTLNYAFGDSERRAPTVRETIVRQRIVEPSVVAKVEQPVAIVEPEPDAEPTPLPSNIYLEGIVFDPYSASLSVESKLVLDRAIDQLSAFPGIRLEVAAHSDISGHTAENLRLSHMRARSVRHYLIMHGLDAANVQAAGYGDTKPRYDNATTEGRAKNRRVELKVME